MEIYEKTQKPTQQIVKKKKMKVPEKYLKNYLLNDKLNNKIYYYDYYYVLQVLPTRAILINGEFENLLNECLVKIEQNV